MPFFSMFMWGKRRTSLLIAALMIGLIAVVDAHAAAEIPLGFLYLAPMLVVGASLTRWEIAAVAAHLRLVGGGVRCVSLGPEYRSCRVICSTSPPFSAWAFSCTR